MRQRHNHKKGFELLRSNSETIAHKTRMGFSLSSSNSEAAGQPCKGFSLVEAAIVLGVVGLVVGGIWVGTAKFYEDYKINKTVEGILTIAKNVQDLISVSDSEAIGGSVVLNTTLINAGAIPKDWIKGNTGINPFGGVILIRNNLPPKFDFYIHSIPSSACARIIMRIAALEPNVLTYYAHGNGLGYILVTPPDWVTTTFPIPIEQAQIACSSGEKTIRFTFGYTRIN